MARRTSATAASGRSQRLAGTRDAPRPSIERGAAERQTEDEHGDGACARSQRQREAALAIAREHVHQRAGIGERMHPDTEHDAGHDERHGEATLAPADDRQAEQADHDHREAGGDQPGRLEVLGARCGRRGVRIANVRQPVAEAAPHLGRGRRVTDGFEGLRVGEDVGATPALDDDGDDPPQRDADRQHADLGGSCDRPPPADPAFRGGDEQPEHRRRCDHQERRRVDSADGGDDQRAECGVAPLRSGAGRARSRPTSQPSAAHGSSIADVRETYGRR